MSTVEDAATATTMPVIGVLVGSTRHTSAAAELEVGFAAIHAALGC